MAVAAIPEGTQKHNGRIMPVPRRPEPIPTVEEQRAEVLAQPETDVSVDEPLRVKLGGTEHEIAPLSIKATRAWRRQWRDAVQRIQDADDQTLAFEVGDWVADLFFAYARNLDRDAIEEAATEAEVLAGYNAVCEYINRPFR